MKLQKKAAVVSSLIGSLLMAVTLTAAEGDPVIEPRAAEVLRSMGTYMNGLSQFTFSATNTHDFVMTGNQKITMFARSNVSVKRPNRVRSDRVGEVVDLQFFDDGSALTLYGPGDNFYAQREFDQNLHAVFDHLRDELGLEVPAGDLLYADPAEEMLAAAESGTYVGLADVGGVMCHHLAFRTPDVDWQIWIETGIVRYRDGTRCSRNGLPALPSRQLRSMTGTYQRLCPIRCSNFGHLTGPRESSSRI